MLGKTFDPIKVIGVALLCERPLPHAETLIGATRQNPHVGTGLLVIERREPLLKTSTKDAPRRGEILTVIFPGQLIRNLVHPPINAVAVFCRSEEHTSELQSRGNLVSRLL